jgi:hypothetical protein
MTPTSRTKTAPVTTTPESGDLPVADEVEEALAPAAEGPSGVSRFRVPPWLRGGSPGLIYAGVAVAVLGFVLILIAWGQVAGETQVYLQVPYLVSAGLTGIGLVMVGLTIVNVTAKQRDAADRDRQMDQLVSILGELKATIADEEDDEK